MKITISGAKAPCSCWQRTRELKLEVGLAPLSDDFYFIVTCPACRASIQTLTAEVERVTFEDMQ